MTHKKLLFYTFSLLVCLVTHTFAADSYSGFPQVIINEMSKRESRYKHYVWHQLRNNWNNYTEDIKKQFRDLGWEPPRPALAYFPNGTSSAITDNLSGEDFLFMHREMVKKVRGLVANDANASAWLTGWKTLPAPGDKDYPVPENYTIPGNPSNTNTTITRKTDDFYNKTIKPSEDTLKSPTQLRRMTLGQLGSRIEFTIHNYLHMRFSSNSTFGFRSTYRGTPPYIDPKWDDPQYNWLGDTYSSHVHPIFWRIHGWVDDRIEDWKAANNVSNITWTGTWTGGPISSLSSVVVLNQTTTTPVRASLRTPLARLSRESEDTPKTSVGDTVDKVMSLVLEAGQDGGFSEEIHVDDFIPESLQWHDPTPVPPTRGKCPLPRSQ